MTTLILDESNLQQLVVAVGIDQMMDDLIRRLRRAFQAFDSRLIQTPQRTGFHYNDPVGLIEWMPLYQNSRQVLMKIVGYHPLSPRQHGLPTIVSTMSTYDTSTGHLTAVVDATFLTAMRTGAASAVATEMLARRDSKVLGLVGCGAQAITQLHAIARCFDIQEVLIYDSDFAAAESFERRANPIVPCNATINTSSLENIARDADIICTATSVGVEEGPVIRLKESKPWLHVNAVGSDLPGKTELPEVFLRQSVVCPDFLPQARVEGECQQLSEDEIGPTIVELAKRSDSFIEERSRRSVFDSTGWVLEDWVAMELVIEAATNLGIGSTINIECLPEDPRNPYGFLGHNGEVTPDRSRREWAGPTVADHARR